MVDVLISWAAIRLFVATEAVFLGKEDIYLY